MKNIIMFMAVNLILFMTIGQKALANGCNCACSCCQQPTGSTDSIQTLIPLPINMLRFDAVMAGTNAQLSWQTNSDASLQYFEVERSSDGSNWAKIGSVPAKNTGANVIDYHFADANMSSFGTQAVYYRLRMVFVSGVPGFSMIRTINIAHAQGRPSLWYNAANRQVRVIIPLVAAKTKVVLTLLSTDGKVLQQKSTALAEGYNDLRMPLPESLPAGLYLVQLQYNTTKTTLKLVKL